MMAQQTTAAAADRVFLAGAGGSRVLLTSTTRWPSSARLMIEFARLGHAVSIVCPAYRHPSRKVRVAHSTFPYKPLAPLDSVADAIGAVKPDIIIPCDDLAVRHLHQLHGRARSGCRVDLSTLIAYSLGAPESYDTVASRSSLLEIAREEGILTPQTQVIESRGDLQWWGFTHGFPCVLKADGTTGGAGVRIAHTLEEARIGYSDLRKPMGLMRSVKHLVVDRDLVLEREWHNLWQAVPRPVVVQAYVRGAAANCAVVCWKGEMLAGMACEAVTTETPVGPATVVRLVDRPAMMTAAQKLARRLSLSGFFGLDFVIEEGTDAAYLIEMNPRCTPPSHLRLGAGRDLVGAFSAQLVGKQLNEPVSITQNNLIAYFPQAWLRNSEFLASCYHDVPETEPELVEELCQSEPGVKAAQTESLRSLFSLGGFARRL